METDSFFCQLLKCLPQTLFELLGQPGERARLYHFDSIEIKKSFRIDGVFLPKESKLPVIFVEVRFQPLVTFYANLFAKVFLVMEANPSFADWSAVAIFKSRSIEPKHLEPYEDLLKSKRVTRVYLDELAMPANPPLGLGILQLLAAPKNAVKDLVANLVDKATREIADREMASKVIELTEELLMRRFIELDREGIRKMFQLHDIRKSKAWQEIHEEALKEGFEEGKALLTLQLVRNWRDKGKTIQEIAELLEVPLKEARRLAKEASK